MVYYMAFGIDLAEGRKTVADMAREVSQRGEKVNLRELASGRDMMVSSLRTADGSTVKLLENDDEVDVIVMKNGRVLTAKGTFVEDEKVSKELACDAICRIANHTAENEDLHVDFWA